MAWELRRKNCWVYYHSERIGKRVVKRYMGHGPAAFFAERLKAVWKKRQQTVAKWIRDRSAEQADLYRAFGELHVLCCFLSKCIEHELAGGFTMSDDAQPISAPVIARLQELLSAVSQGDQAAEAEARALLQQYPQLWDTVGNLSGHAKQTWIGLIAGSNPVLQDALRRRMQKIVDSLTGVAATAVERLLAEQLAMSWLQLQHANVRLAEGMEAPVGAQSFLSRQQKVAQSHFMESLKLWEKKTRNKPLPTAVEETLTTLGFPRLWRSANEVVAECAEARVEAG